MKKIMIIDGGPRKNFNTASMLQKDALTPALEEIAGADGPVLGSPIYFGDVTGQTSHLSTFMNWAWRHSK